MTTKLNPRSRRGLGVFSDIHGNRRAFAAVIETVKRRQDLEWLCLGDVVGWFFRPIECVLMLKALVDEGLVRTTWRPDREIRHAGSDGRFARVTPGQIRPAFGQGPGASSAALFPRARAAIPRGNG